MTVRSSINRRSFLKQTGAVLTAAVSAPLVLPSSVLGREGVTAPNSRVNMAFIGCGRQTYKKNLPLFMRTKGVKVVAVCDVDSWRLDQTIEQIKKQYATGRVRGKYTPVDKYVDYNDVLARKDVDAVMIATPDHWHAKMAVDAMKAGKDVSLEKPITRTIKEGQDLIKAAKENNRIFRVDSDFRSVEGVHRATSLVRNGYIGKVKKVTVCVPQSDVPCPPQPDMPVPPELDYERWQGPAPRAAYTLNRVHPVKDFARPGWMRNLYYCDGMITNWGTHLNNGAMWATNLDHTGPTDIEATGEYPGRESFWNVLLKFNVNFRFADGLEWTYRTEKPYFFIEGEDGWVRANFKTFDAYPKSLLTLELKPSDQHFRFKSEKQDFVECVRNREETLEPAEVGHRVTSMGILAHISIKLGRKLKFDPAAEKFIDNDAANAYLDKPILEPRYA